MSIRFLSALACENVSTDTDHKPDAKLNKARVKKGKTPLFEYKVLKINTQVSATDANDSSGTHASPRTHLRRGHIRKLKNGKTIWVNGCVVSGSKEGIVNKDYLVV